MNSFEPNTKTSKVDKRLKLFFPWIFQFEYQNIGIHKMHISMNNERKERKNIERDKKKIYYIGHTKQITRSSFFCSSVSTGQIIIFYLYTYESFYDYFAPYSILLSANYMWPI